MSMSTPGGDRQPSTVRVTTGDKPGDKTGGKPGASRPSGPKGARGPKGRKITPVKVQQTRNWGPIGAAVAVVLVAGAIVGYAVWSVATSNADDPWETRAAAIPGIVNYRNNPDKSLTAQEHKAGSIRYKINPPVGGEHNNAWQNCMGDIYDAPIANEHAVHSLEHGAVWLTYKVGTPADQVEILTKKIQGKPFTMMSPVESLPSMITLQAWGYQLKVDTADDPRIDQFINALALNASMEPGIPCSGGITTTGSTPRDGVPAGQ